MYGVNPFTESNNLILIMGISVSLNGKSSSVSHK